MKQRRSLRWILRPIPAVCLALGAACGGEPGGAGNGIAELPLLPGDTLTVAINEAGGAPFEAPVCWSAFLMDPDCGGCRMLAARLAAPSGRTPAAYWLFVGDVEKMRRFVTEHDLPRDRILRVALDGPAHRVLDDLRVRGTPTQFVFTDRGAISHMSLSPRLYDPRELAEACSG